MKNKIGIFDLVISLYAPAYHKLNKEEMTHHYKDKKIKDAKNWLAMIFIHIFTIALYFFIGWILRQDVFLCKFQVSEHKSVNATSFLTNVTSKSEILPYWWQFLIILFSGCLLIYNAFVLLYYKLCHPWNIGMEEIR